MKTILVVAGEENKLFSSRLKLILRDLGIEAEFNCRDNDYKSFYDYIVLNSSCTISNIVLNGSYCFINMDQTLGSNINVNSNIITYGFGNKNTVTVSSVEREDMEMLYCLQRFINTPQATVSPLELPINIGVDREEEIYACLVGVTMALMENLGHKKVKNILDNRSVVKNI